MLRIYEDPDDRLGTVVQINCLANREAGVIVGHAPPSGLREALPQDLLLALGHRESAKRWPRTAGPAWTLARAWMAGFQVSHLIIYGAWRLTEKLVEMLREIAAVDGVDVNLVTLATMSDRLPSQLASLPADPVNVLLDGVGVPRPVADRASPGVGVRLPDGLPPLPPADITCFRTECEGCIDDRELWLQFVESFDSLTDSLSRQIGDASSADGLLELLEQQLRQARGNNEVLVRVRAFQIAALLEEWHVQIPLRDVGLATAMALNTDTANHPDWPLAANIEPQAQAIAALALATRRASEQLSAATIGDVDANAKTFDGEPIAPALRPAIRAQTWMQARRGMGEADPLFCTKNGKPLRVNAIRGVLDEISPEAFRASALGPTRLGRRLAQLVEITHVAADSELGGDDRATCGLLPSASYRSWVRENGGSTLNGDTGLPDGHGQDSGLDAPRAYRQAMEIATGFAEPPRWPSNRRSSALGAREHLDADSARLHSVLLQAGGGADRLSLLHGLQWSAQHLHTAERTLRTNLSGTAEVLAATVDGRLEVRVRTDPVTDAALAKVRRRDDCDRGLSPVGSRLLLQLLIGPREGVFIDRIELPPDIAQAAIEELHQRQLISTSANEGWIRLAPIARLNLRAWERERLPATFDFA